MFKVNGRVLKKVVDLVISSNTVYSDFGGTSESFHNSWKELNSYLECLQDLEILSEDECLDIALLQYKELTWQEIEFQVTKIMVKIPNNKIDDFDLIEQF